MSKVGDDVETVVWYALRDQVGKYLFTAQPASGIKVA